MGASAPVKYHYSYCFFYLFNEAGLVFRPTSGVKVLRGPTRVEDIVRWGVWLGRHIC